VTGIGVWNLHSGYVAWPSRPSKFAAIFYSSNHVTEPSCFVRDFCMYSWTAPTLAQFAAGQGMCNCNTTMSLNYLILLTLTALYFNVCCQHIFVLFGVRSPTCLFCNKAKSSVITVHQISLAIHVKQIAPCSSVFHRCMLCTNISLFQRIPRHIQVLASCCDLFGPLCFNFLRLSAIENKRRSKSLELRIFWLRVDSVITRSCHSGLLLWRQKILRIVDLLFHMIQLINRKNTKSHHVKRKPVVREH